MLFKKKKMRLVDLRKLLEIAITGAVNMVCGKRDWMERVGRRKSRERLSPQKPQGRLGPGCE